MASRKKRKHPRARGKGLSVHFTGANGLTACTVEDISLGGLFIRTAEEFLPGTHLALTLVRPGMKKGLALPSVVANLRTPGPGRQAGVGVRFEGVAEEIRSRLMVLLVELGLVSPATPEEDMGQGEAPAGVARDPGVPPPLPLERGSAGLGGIQVMSQREIALRLEALSASGDRIHSRPEGSAAAPVPLTYEAPDFNEHTSVMSQTEVARHVANTLSTDWSAGFAPPVVAEPPPRVAAVEAPGHVAGQAQAAHGAPVHSGSRPHGVAAAQPQASAPVSAPSRPHGVAAASAQVSTGSRPHGVTAATAPSAPVSTASRPHVVAAATAPAAPVDPASRPHGVAQAASSAAAAASNELSSSPAAAPDDASAARSRAPAAAPGPSLHDLLQLQIRGLLLQLGESEQRVAAQDAELDSLRAQVTRLTAALEKKEVELAKLRLSR